MVDGKSEAICLAGLRKAKYVPGIGHPIRNAVAAGSEGPEIRDAVHCGRLLPTDIYRGQRDYGTEEHCDHEIARSVSHLFCSPWAQLPLGT